MRRDAELLRMLLGMVAEIEDLTAQAMNAGCEDTRIIRLGLMLAGMLHMYEKGDEGELSRAVTQLVLHNIDNGKKAGDAVNDLLKGIDGINLN